MHWLACALYVACRKTVVVPTVGSGSIEGNCVSLTRLIRSCQLRWVEVFLMVFTLRCHFCCWVMLIAWCCSLLEFFKKMKKWLDMANLPKDFRDKVDRLERNFAVSTVIFKKFEPIFLTIFKDPTSCPPRPPRSRKQRYAKAYCSKLFFKLRLRIILDPHSSRYHCTYLLF